MSIVSALKKLAVAMGAAEAEANVTGNTVADVLEYIAEHYTKAAAAASTESETKS